MKKRIVAAVLSLLLAASAVPMGEFASFLPDTSITATAANQSGKVTVMSPTGNEVEISYTVTDSADGKTLSISAPVGYFANTATVEVNTANIKSALQSEGVAVTGYKFVEFNYNFASNTSGRYYHSVLAKVVFKDSFITKIGANMFKGLRTLTSVDLGSSIKYIGANAFSGCVDFAGSGTNNTIDLSKVVEIADSAFSGCTTLAGATLSTSLKTISKQAFSGCTNIKKISIPASVTSIGQNAFANNTSLTDVTFAAGSKLSELGDSAFSGCSFLENVLVGTSTKNTLPSGINTTVDDKGNMSLGKNIFQNCVKLQNFQIPSTYKELSEGMFSGCTTLQDVDFTKANSLKVIGIRCFRNCSGIVEMTLSDNVKFINPEAFNGCKQLKKLILPDELEAFVPALANTQTFANCPVLSMAPKSKAKQLKSNQILIPDGITHITACCFMNCTGITNVDLNNVATIAEGAFSNCTSLPNITVPDAVTIINKDVFNGCTSLKDVKYSKNLTEIGVTAFKKCSSLVTLTPSNKTKITNTIQLTPSCAAIHDSAFADCTSLKYVNVLGGASSQLSTVGTSAFSGCTSLEGATTDGTSSQELKFPKGVIVIRDRTFEKCSSLKAVQFEGNVTSMGKSVFQNCTALTTVKVNATITQIGESAFSGCSSLKDLPVTSKGASAVTQLEKIDKYTFQNCTSLTVVNISAAKNLKTIDANAFAGCTNMTKFIMPASGKVSSIGAGAFQNCEKLAVVNTSVSATTSAFPTSIINIDANAFNKTALTSVKLSKPSEAGAYNVLGDNVFANCANLKEADFSGSNLTSVPKGAFSADKALTTVKLPATLETIGESAFDNCENLSKINSTTKGTAQLPSNVKTISGYAFRNNYNISKFVIPAATDNIDLSAFNATLNYTQQDIDSGKYNPIKEFVVDSANENYKATSGVLYTKDGTQLLRYPMMKAGKSFTVPSGVTRIVSSGMGSNNNLETVKIGTSVKQIDNQAFYKMQNLRSVDFGTNTTVKLADNSFSSLSSNPKVVFYGAAGSTAEAYAKKYSSFITFVDNNKKATKITIKQGTNINISRAGGSIKLEAVLTTASGEVTSDVIKWVSDDINIASISNDGTLSPRKDGTTTVTATTANGLSVKVTVNVGEQVVRLAGNGRYATAAEISKKGFPSANTVVLAYGLNSADALAGVPLAKAYNAPILLTTTKSLPAETLAEIKRLKATNVIILGGEGAISKAVETTLKNNGLKTERIAGTSRFETATKIAEKLAEKNSNKPKEIFFVYAYNFADALSASTVAAVKGAPVIYLQTKGEIDKATAAYLADVKGSVKQAYVIGGTGVISDAMMKSAATALGLKSGSTVRRIAGANRYGTCVEVNKTFADSMPGTALCIATGADFPDALAGGVFAAAKSAPLFLVNNAAKKLDDTQTAYLKTKQAKQFFVFGGTGAVSDNTVNQVKAVR